MFWLQLKLYSKSQNFGGKIGYLKIIKIRVTEFLVSPMIIKDSKNKYLPKNYRPKDYKFKTQKSNNSNSNKSLVAILIKLTPFYAFLLITNKVFTVSRIALSIAFLYVCFYSNGSLKEQFKFRMILTQTMIIIDIRKAFKK